MVYSDKSSPFCVGRGRIGLGVWDGVVVYYGVSGVGGVGSIDMVVV